MKIKRKHQRIALLLALVFFIMLGIMEQDKRPKEEEIPPQKVTSFPINLNSASVDDLVSIPGIGPVKARRIIEYRESHGPFSSVEELVNVSGIGEKTLKKISEYVMVEGVEQPTRSEVTKLNVNTASLEELETLPYIGEAKAKAIIEYREEHGPFSSPEDLLSVPGIGEKTLERIRGKITF